MHHLIKFQHVYLILQHMKLGAEPFEDQGCHG